MGEELVEQQPSERSKCPECGGDPCEIGHTLSDLGYLHDDQRMMCEDCGNQWTCGVPIGETSLDERAEELFCDSCDDAFMLVHRAVRTRHGNITFHLKCPNCYYFEQLTRVPDEKGRVLLGYPQITGETEGCPVYGYDESEHSGDDVATGE